MQIIVFKFLKGGDDWRKGAERGCAPPTCNFYLTVKHWFWGGGQAPRKRIGLVRGGADWREGAERGLAPSEPPQTS